MIFQASLQELLSPELMMRTLKISTYLAADLERLLKQMTPALLNYVVAGLMKFHPIEPNFFPSKWVEGKFSVKTFHFWAHRKTNCRYRISTKIRSLGSQRSGSGYSKNLGSSNFYRIR